MMRVAQTAPNECNCVIINFYVLWHFLSRMTSGCISILRPLHYITQVQSSKVVVYVWNESCVDREERGIVHYEAGRHRDSYAWNLLAHGYLSWGM